MLLLLLLMVSHYYTSDEGAMLVHLITLHGHSPPRASNLRSLELTWNVLFTGQCMFFPSMHEAHSFNSYTRHTVSGFVSSLTLN